MFGRRARHCRQYDRLHQTVECLPDPGGRSFQRSTRLRGRTQRRRHRLTTGGRLRQDGGIDNDQISETIATTKRKLRSRLPNYVEVLADVEAHTRAEVEDILGAGDRAIPEIDFAAIAAGGVGATTLAAIRRRGVVVVRKVFPAEQATAWNDELGDYVTRNGFYEQRADPNLDQYFSSLKSRKPQIFGIYWSRPQVRARQSPALTATRTFLTGLWRSSGPTGEYFDPRRQCTYADRIRRREPGDTTLGLSAHMDAGSVERWIDPSYQSVYRKVFSGDWRGYDPFDGAFRTEVKEIPSPAVCSVFRTYQGWTALTQQGPNDGTLRVVPIANGIMLMLLRALQDDVAEDELCGAKAGRGLRALPQWHETLLSGMIPIPTMEPGDTIWWHPDVLHAVEDRHMGSGFSNVMYIAAAPWCAKNAAYLKGQQEAFLRGASAPDFAAEDFEVGYAGRATLDDLTELGRAQMGIEPK